MSQDHCHDPCSGIEGNWKCRSSQGCSNPWIQGLFAVPMLQVITLRCRHPVEIVEHNSTLCRDLHFDMFEHIGNAEVKQTMRQKMIRTR